MTDIHHHTKTSYGEFRAVCTQNAQQQDDLLIAISNSTGFDERKLNNLALLLESEYERVGLIEKVEVYQGNRGFGYGRYFIEQYMSEIAPHTEVDLVFARISNPQSPGFNLVDFYGKYGFEPVAYSSGDLLMANKDQAHTIKLYMQPAHQSAEFCLG